MDGWRARATCDVRGVVSGGLARAWCAVYMPGGGGGTASTTTTTTHTTTTRESTATATDSRAPSTEDGARVVTTTTSSGRIRASRARCHAARDAYVAACARTDEPTNDASGSGGAAVTTTAAATAAACVTLRAAYDAACPRSWVDHFDARRAEDAKVRRVLASREGGA